MENGKRWTKTRGHPLEKPNVNRHRQFQTPSYRSSAEAVVKTTSRCHHKTSWSFVETAGTSVARPNILLQHFEASQSLKCEQMSTSSARCFWLGTLDFRITLTSSRCARQTDWHSATHHFNLALPLRSFDVGRECKICLSASGVVSLQSKIHKSTVLNR